MSNAQEEVKSAKSAAIAILASVVMIVVFYPETSSGPVNN
jgi:hypothetical protein